MTPEQEAAALRFDPWADDMDSDARTLADRFVVTRKASQCAVCLEHIPAGERVRAQRQVSHDEGKAMTFRFCVACCEAMARTRLDGSCASFDAMAARFSVGIANARQTVPLEPIA